MVTMKKPDTSKDYDKDIKDIWAYLKKLYAALNEESMARAREENNDHAKLANLDYSTAGHAGFVPATRTINGNDLGADVTLDYADVGASASAHTHTSLTQEDWVEVLDASMTNSWVNIGGSTYNSTAYFKDTLGIVHLKGIIKSGTIGAAAFTLPSGYRPTLTSRFVVVSNDAIGYVDISSAGVVTPGLGANNYVALDGIAFRSA